MTKTIYSKLFILLTLSMIYPVYNLLNVSDLGKISASEVVHVSLLHEHGCKSNAPLQ